MKWTSIHSNDMAEDFGMQDIYKDLNENLWELLFLPSCRLANDTLIPYFVVLTGSLKVLP